MISWLILTVPAFPGKNEANKNDRENQSNDRENVKS